MGAPIVGESPCELLVRRVCGENRDCGDRPACVRVRELLEKERRERAASGRPGRMTLASGQCQEADRDRESYRSCER
ncbi:MAG TPA: hypothetical protein ENK05_08315 [Gammaproteobacteria bacterium]|nr:hypothetical protein [Gammaproteobacteria bacterium]